MNYRQLGQIQQPVSAISLGAMGMSDLYGAADERESTATIHAALDAGVNLIDTGDFYGMGHNELLIGRALAGRKRDQVLLSVKFGALRGPDGSWTGVDNRPQAIKNFVAYSLKRLGVDYIDIYRPARLDPSVPVEDVAGAISELVQAGYVRYLGLSEVGADTVRRAHAVHPVADLQIEYSVLSRGVEARILPTLRELGIGMTAYGVLSRGLISNSTNVQYPANDFRAYLPRFQGENLSKNQALVQALNAIAAEKGATVAQLAIAWVLAQDPLIVPLVGARRRERLQEALGALAVKLTAADLERIAAAVPAEAVAGTRYQTDQMAHLDSERN